MPKKKQPENEAREITLSYCDNIIRKKIPACVYTIKAVKRFMDDLKRTDDEGWDYFLDWNIPQKFLAFSRMLAIDSKGTRLSLLPWQVFIFANLLGFRYKSNPNKMRFRSGAVFVPRKNGKTTGLLYPLLLWDMVVTTDAQAFFFEKDDKQAAHMLEDIKGIVQHSPILKDFRSYADVITYKASRLKCFGSENKGIDGYKPSVAVIDEYFCFASDRPVTAMRYGTRARLNGLVLIITTAGNDISLPAYSEDEKVRKILNGVLTDEAYFGIIYGIDDKDDWKTEAAYVKANPSINAIIDRAALKQDLIDALNQPSHQADYIAKTLNRWTNETTSWIPISKWDTAIRKKPTPETPGASCVGGFDLSSVSDFTAYTLCFHIDGFFYFRHRFYIPEQAVFEKYRTENINILEWIHKGIVTATPGNTVDYEYIKNDIIRDAENFNMIELAFDPWQSKQLVKELETDLTHTEVFDYPQSMAKMSSASKDYEKTILDDKIVDNNPCQKWMVSNTVIYTDANGNIKPRKENKSSGKRIDGVITSIMALDRMKQYMGQTAEKPGNIETLLALFR
ncbi:MAG: terminase large subunit [Treponema sp.]|nr:terminase large subunit [Treponema sp.]